MEESCAAVWGKVVFCGQRENSRKTVRAVCELRGGQYRGKVFVCSGKVLEIVRAVCERELRGGIGEKWFFVLGCGQWLDERQGVSK